MKAIKMTKIISQHITEMQSDIKTNDKGHFYRQPFRRKYIVEHQTLKRIERKFSTSYH